MILRRGNDNLVEIPSLLKIVTAENIVKAALCLHNFIIKERMKDGTIGGRSNKLVRNNGDLLPHLNDILPENVHDIREILTDYFNSIE